MSTRNPRSPTPRNSTPSNPLEILSTIRRRPPSTPSSRRLRRDFVASATREPVASIAPRSLLPAASARSLAADAFGISRLLAIGRCSDASSAIHANRFVCMRMTRWTQIRNPRSGGWLPPGPPADAEQIADELRSRVRAPVTLLGVDLLPSPFHHDAPLPISTLPSRPSNPHNSAMRRLEFVRPRSGK